MSYLCWLKMLIANRTPNVIITVILVFPRHLHHRSQYQRHHPAFLVIYIPACLCQFCRECLSGYEIGAHVPDLWFASSFKPAAVKVCVVG
jgi:hypothetical protein